MRVAADGVGLTQFGGVVVIMKRTSPDCLNSLVNAVETIL